MHACDQRTTCFFRSPSKQLQRTELVHVNKWKEINETKFQTKWSYHVHVSLQMSEHVTKANHCKSRHFRSQISNLKNAKKYMKRFQNYPRKDTVGLYYNNCRLELNYARTANKQTISIGG